MSKRRVGNPRLIEKRLPILISASTVEFDKRGFHATTVQDIASNAGVSVGMIYQYVEDKQGLLFLVISSIVSAYEVQLECRPEGSNESFQDLCDLIFAIAHVVDSHKAAARIGYRESRYLSQDQLADIKRRERNIGESISRRINACIAAGELLPVNTEMLSYQFLIFVQSWAVSAWRFKEGVTCDQYVHQGLQLLLNGAVSSDKLENSVQYVLGRPHAYASSKDRLMKATE